MKNKFISFLERFLLRPDKGSIGIGLIGVGGWGLVNAKNIMRSKRFSIKGIFDVDIIAARRFGQNYQIKNFDNIDELLKDPTIQAVCISVPNDLHLELTLKAISSGKHIFIEKPLVSFFSDCDLLEKILKDKKNILQVGHQMRMEPVFDAIKDILERNSLGRLLFVNGIYTLDRTEKVDWRQNSKSCPFGSMEQLGVHIVDILVALKGPPFKVSGWVDRRCDLDRCFEWYHLNIRFKDNTRAFVSTSFSSSRFVKIEFFFEKGRFETDLREIKIWNSKNRLKKLVPSGRSGGVVQFVRFAESIEFGRPVVVGISEAKEIIRIINCVER